MNRMGGECDCKSFPKGDSDCGDCKGTPKGYNDGCPKVGCDGGCKNCPKGDCGGDC